ncbi:MAG: hypothetical protein ABJC74_06330, partial [Gemmatimonadota bacterium]
MPLWVGAAELERAGWLEIGREWLGAVRGSLEIGRPWCDAGRAPRWGCEVEVPPVDRRSSLARERARSSAFRAR